MLAPELRQAVARLAESVLAVRPLAGALESPVRVASGIQDGAAVAGEGGVGIDELLNQLTTRLEAPRLRLCRNLATTDLPVFERVVSEYLRVETYYEPASRVPAELLYEVDRVVEEVIGASFVHNCLSSEVTSFDGAPLKAYALGEPQDKAVVIAPPCGMPVELCERWLRLLAREHFVVTWESRGLFGETDFFEELAWSVTAQASDLFAVMDHFGVAAGHLMGMCGGAVIALAAATARPSRVTSLSLWHGDYELGPECPKTMYQYNLKALLSMAGEDRASAASVRTIFCQSTLRNAIPDLAHWTLYPYANSELLFRYSKLNGSIMETDVSSLLDRVAQPTLVVTSEDDDKTHPAGSRHVAAGLANATLHVEPKGDHISLFNAGPQIAQLAVRFISCHSGL